MRWSWTIGRVAGIKLRVHATFVLVLAWLALVEYHGSVRGSAIALLFTLALFACVVLHELGHALAARRCGISTRDITLLPIGGVARIEGMPDHPRQELKIALAGPAATAVLVLALVLVLRVAGWPSGAGADSISDATLPGFVADLMWVNVVLFFFNLLPAFPMDGGRVLRALLSLRMDHARATDLSAQVGRSFALVFGTVGLLYNPLLALIALFIWVSATATSQDLSARPRNSPTRPPPTSATHAA